MFIYYSSAKKAYRYKDFSTSKFGDAINLVQELFNLSTRGEAAHKIIEDYNQVVLTSKEDYEVREFKVHSKYRVTSFVTREWNTLDQKYWTKYSIGSKMLETYCVKPLDHYILSKTEEGEVKELTIKGNHIYGYFRKDGSLYKIYQPMVKDTKFMKVKEYIQGSEQLTGNVPYHSFNIVSTSFFVIFKISLPAFFKPLFVVSGVYRDWETDRKSTRLNSSHSAKSRMPSSA